MNEDIEEIWETHETRVSSEEVERARAESAADEVVCQECARALGQITAQHLQIHDMGLAEYEAKYPDAPIYPADVARQPGREPGFTHPEDTKQKIAKSTKRNHERGVYE